MALISQISDHKTTKNETVSIEKMITGKSKKPNLL